MSPPGMRRAIFSETVKEKLSITGIPKKSAQFHEQPSVLFLLPGRAYVFALFLWNFAGRQNDIQGFGGPLNGNWISGIGPVDDLLIGSQEKLPDEMKNAPSRNTYFLLPLILGLFGLCFMSSAT